MANLDDLGYTSILDMSNDEAIELLRQIRLRRRTPEKAQIVRSIAKTNKGKLPIIDAATAAELLRILGG